MLGFFAALAVLALVVGARRRMLPRQPLEVADGTTDQERDEFPPHPRGEVPAVPMPPCRIYYPSFGNLNNDQRTFYVYWRQEAERGNFLAADATYRFLYVYELAMRCDTAESLEAHWTRLWNAYPKTDSFGYYVSAWITDLRLMRGRFIFDDVTQGLHNHGLALDVAIAANTAPRASFLLERYSKRPWLRQSTYQRIISQEELLNAIDTSAVLVAAKTAAPTELSQSAFINMGAAQQSLRRFGNLKITYPSYQRSTVVQQVIDEIAEAILQMLGIQAPKQQYSGHHLREDPEIITQLVVGSGSSGVPIVRPAATRSIIDHVVASLPPADTLDGVLWTIDQRTWSNEALTLLLLVLWLSDTKPFIEGRILFSTELRRYYEAIAEDLNVGHTIGSARRAFSDLGLGVRAIWTLDPRPENLTDIRVNITGARFIKGIQHALVGSAARTTVINAVTLTLTQHLKKTHYEVCDIFTKTTGTTPDMRTQGT